jgi:serralysin
MTVISTATTTPLVLNSDDVLFITATGSLIPAASKAPISIAENQENVDIFLDGTVAKLDLESFTANGAIQASNTTSGIDLSIGTTGVLRSIASGVMFFGSDCSVRNLGLIEAVSTGILVNSGGNVANLGTILAGTGISGSYSSIRNTGSILAEFTGITGNSVGNSILNSGTISGGNKGIATANTGATLHNTGLVFGAAIAAEFSSAINGLLENGGEIRSTQIGVKVAFGNGFNLSNSGIIAAGQTALDLGGNNMTVTNSGTIEGGTNGVLYAVNLITGGNIALTNTATGHIIGGDRGLLIELNDDADLFSLASIRNAGEISGSIAGISVANLPLVLHNSGTISALNGVAVQINGEQNARIVNTGTIESALPANLGDAVAIDFSGVLGGGLGTLRNFGQIIGSVQFGDNTDLVRNRGLIDGDVLLDIGNDTYDGRGGEVTGQIIGGAGNDTILGGAFADVIRAGDGSDLVQAGADDDILRGGIGKDTLTGGAGADVFAFTSAEEVSQGTRRDSITDYQTGVDRIDFNFGPTKIYIGSATFSGIAGQIRYDPLTGRLQGDMTGDSAADFQLDLTNRPVLTSADFVL